MVQAAKTPNKPRRPLLPLILLSPALLTHSLLSLCLLFLWVPPRLTDVRWFWLASLVLIRIRGAHIANVMHLVDSGIWSC